MEITINGNKQDLNFGLGFVHEANEKWNSEKNGMKINLGVAYVFTAMQTNDIEQLTDIVYLATSENKHRCSHKDVMHYVDSLSVEEMEELFDQVAKEVDSSAPVQFAVKKIKAAAKEAQRKAKKIK